jgi:hypothetical protein
VVTITQSFEDENEPTEALSWRQALIVIETILIDLRNIYKYSEQPEEIKTFAEDLRAKIIDDCNDRGVRWE